MTGNEPTAAQWAAPGASSDTTPPAPPAWATAPPPGMPPPPPVPPGAQPPLPGYSPPAPPRPGQGAPPGGPSFTFRSWQPGIVALRPLPFGEFLTVPFKAMRFARGALIGGPLLAFTLTGLVTAAAVWLAFTDDRLKLTSSDNSLTGIEPETVVVIIAAVVLAVLSDLVATAIVYPAVGRAALGERLGLAEALRAAWPRLGALFVFSLMVGAVGLVGVAVAASPLIGMASDDPTTSIAASQIANLTTNGFSIVWGLIVTPLIVVARGAIILERKGPIQGLKRAFSLIKGRFWWSVLIYLVVSTVTAFMLYAFLVVEIIIAVVGFGVATSQAVVGATLIVVAVLMYVATAVVIQYSFAGSVGALVYLDLRFRKEGLGMELARVAEASHQARSRTIA